MPIYCDGFIKYKDYRNGCSVGLIKDDEVIKKKVYLVENSSPKIKKLFELRSTAFMLEYFALLHGAIWISKLEGERFLYSDNEVVVKQVRGEYKINKKEHKIMADLINKILPNYATVLWVSRKANVKYLGH